MAKIQEKKRKLELDQSETATAKRPKPSKDGQSGKRAALSTNAIPKSPTVSTSKTSNHELQKTKTRLDQGVESATDKTGGNVAQPDLSLSTQVTEGTPQKSSKRSRKRKSTQHDELTVVATNSQNVEQSAAAGAIVPSARNGGKEQRAPETKAGQQTTRAVQEEFAVNTQLVPQNEQDWRLSPPIAGRYIDHDPLFVNDEDGNLCLIAATARAVQLLSLDSSLVVRTHVVPDGRSILCFARSTVDQDSIDVAYDNGTKVQWNWITSKVLRGTFPGQENTIAMTTTAVGDGRPELFYIAYAQSTSTIVGERKSLYTTQRQLTSIEVLQNGAYIVCIGTDAVIIGARKETGAQSDYVWVELPSEVPIRCVDARLVSVPSKKKQSHRPEFSLAVGKADGEIHLYTELVSLFERPSQAQLPPPQVLHWHREAVSAVKFSKDGNYLISGGKETVLVLWQLQTGKQQFLPHLTSEIERIVVSPDGSQYALQMGDNSIMVMSTSELKAVANFAGLQYPVVLEQPSADLIIPPRTAAVLHPLDPYQLLLSVPATQPKTVRDITARPFVQTFDVRHSRHISRQALTRNNVTDFNLGPEQTPIIPPDVSQVALSADGKWMATVDEWYPPATDLEHVVARTTGLGAEEIALIREEQAKRREVNLKFWHWDNIQRLWTLSTVAATPHDRTANAEPGGGAGSVLGLASDLASNSFATVGEEGTVKIWRPKTRTKHGLALKEPDGTDAVDWFCKHAIPLAHPPEILPEESWDRADSPLEELDDEHGKAYAIVNACLAFVPDGSMLACSLVTETEVVLPLVHFLSPHVGAVIASKAELVAPEQEVIAVGFLDRFLVTLATSSIRVWNLVDDSHHYTIALPGMPDDQLDSMLAVNHSDETFAVITYNQGTGVPVPSLSVYSPTKPQCLFETELTMPPAALLAANGKKGFTVLFEDGTIRTLSTALSSMAGLPPTGGSVTPPYAPSAFSSADTTAALVSAPALNDDDNVEDPDITSAAPPFALTSGEYTTADVEDDRMVVRPEQLSAILDRGESFAMPSLAEMFQELGVLGSRTPRRHARAAANEAGNLVSVEG